LRSAELDLRRRGIVARPSWRYTRFVAFMKFMLPAVAAGLLLLIAAWPRLQSRLEQLRASFTRLDLSDASDLHMVNARFRGLDKQHRPYLVTAEIARQMPDRNDIISLEGPEADITLTNGTWVALTSFTGVYYNQPQLLDLFGAVKVYHDRGYELTTDSAHINVADSSARGSDPVQGHGVFGTIVAEGFRLEEHGETIYFTGKAKLHIEPRAEGAPP
jgi:lipopolysaccharide export system protein LptC